MRVTEKGQVTIPKDLRDALGIGAGTEVEFERAGDAIVVRKARRGPTRGEQLVERLLGRGDVRMSTDEIMAVGRMAPDAQNPAAPHPGENAGSTSHR